MNLLKMYLSLYKFKRRHHLYSYTSGRASSNSRVDLFSNQWSYQVNTGCHFYYMWDSATYRFMAWHVMTWEMEFLWWLSPYSWFQLYQISRVDAIGTYSFQHPGLKCMRRKNNILKKRKAIHLIKVSMLFHSLRGSQHQFISINMFMESYTPLVQFLLWLVNSENLSWF